MVPLSYLDDILEGVTGKDFISSLATNDDFEIARRPLRQLIESHDQRVADRSIHVPDDLREQIKIVRSTLNLVMGRSEQPGGFGRIMGLVAWGGEADRVGVDLVTRLGHQRDKQGGIDSGA